MFLLFSQLKIKALQTCKSVFSKHSSSVSSVHFIHALGPEVVEVVRACGEGDGDVGVAMEAAQVLEQLLVSTPDDKCKFTD